MSKINHEEIILAQLGGRYKHYCADWDDMAIDEHCPEFESCLCFDRMNPDVQFHKHKWSLIHEEACRQG